MVQIVWLDEAKNDLKEIYDYISLDSSTYAKYQVIKTSASILSTLPKIGKIVEELGKEDIREMIEENYRIIYKLKSSKEIRIILIHHSSRSLKQRIK